MKEFLDKTRLGLQQKAITSFGFMHSVYVSLSGVAYSLARFINPAAYTLSFRELKALAYDLTTHIQESRYVTVDDECTAQMKGGAL